MPKKQALQPRRFGPTKPPVHLDHGAAAASACVVQEATAPGLLECYPAPQGGRTIRGSYLAPKEKAFHTTASAVGSKPLQGREPGSSAEKHGRKDRGRGRGACLTQCSPPFAPGSARVQNTVLTRSPGADATEASPCRLVTSGPRSSSASFLNRLGHTRRRASQGSASTDSLAPQTCFLAWKRPQVSLYLWC